MRLEVFRARQRADRAAQTLGYAVYRARNNAADLGPEDYERHSSEIRRAEEEIDRLERQLSDLRRPQRTDPGVTANPPAPTT